MMNYHFVEKDFSSSTATLHEIKNLFTSEIKKTFPNKSKDFRMIPSYLGLPSQKEEGTYIAIDFGGTYIRCMRIRLYLKTWVVEKEKRFLLREIVPCSAEELFEKMAREVFLITRSDEEIDLGFSFSYAGEQKDFSEMILLDWAKEVQIEGLLGKPLNQLLRKALHDAERPLVRPQVILNDGVASLLAGHYFSKEILISLVCGTGFNLCYFAENHSVFPMIINLEAGYFEGLPQENIDIQVDQSSDDPGKKMMEKQVGGRYLAEIAQKIILEMLTSLDKSYFVENLIEVVDLAMWQEGETLQNWLDERQLQFSLGEKEKMQALSIWTLKRSARWAGAALAGLAEIIRENGYKGPVGAIVEGSLYQKIPYYSEQLRIALKELNVEIRLITIEDASSIGAAVAAGMISNPK